MAERNRATHRTFLAGLGAIALIAASCGQATPSTSPAASAGSTTAPTVAPTASPQPTTGPTAKPTATPAPTTAEACPTDSGLLPSDRMVNVVISTSATADLVTFVFGEPSSPAPPQGPSEGLLEQPAVPPYVEGASGLPIDVDGEHVVFVRFSGMSLVNDVGQLTYDGQTDFRPDLPALKSVINSEQFEGVIGWYIGFDGPGCATLQSGSDSVTVVVEHAGS